MRSGKLAVYRGRRYRVGSYDDVTISLLSEDPEDLKLGFTVHRNGLYFKRVRRDEVEEAFRLHTFGEYQGVRVEVVEEKDGLLRVESFQDLPGFRRTDKFTSERWLKPSELDRVWEEKTPL